MGILEDYKSVCTSWKELGPLSKVLGGCTVLLAGLSIASVADATFKFKGFIQTGIKFYQSITEPLRSMLNQLLWFEIPEQIFHLLVLVTVGVSATIRASAGNEMRKQILDAFITVRLILMCPLLLKSLFNIDSNYIPLGVAVMFPFLLWFIYGFIMQLTRDISNVIEPEDRSIKTLRHVHRLAATYVLTSYLLVCIIAGVSEGIFRAG